MIQLTPFRAELFHNDLFKDMPSKSNTKYINIYFRSVAGQWFDNNGYRVTDTCADLLEEQYQKEIKP